MASRWISLQPVHLADCAVTVVALALLPVDAGNPLGTRLNATGID